VRNRKENEYLQKGDPVFGSYIPNLYKMEEVKNDISLHPELKKMVYSTLPEDPNTAGMSI
jgi:aromatic ring hydroxylase